MHFVSDAIAEIGGLLVVNRDFCKRPMMQKALLAPPLNESVLPSLKYVTLHAGYASCAVRALSIVRQRFPNSPFSPTKARAGQPAQLIYR